MNEDIVEMCKERLAKTRELTHKQQIRNGELLKKTEKKLKEAKR